MLEQLKSFLPWLLLLLCCCLLSGCERKPTPSPQHNLLLITCSGLTRSEIHQEMLQHQALRKFMQQSSSYEACFTPSNSRLATLISLWTGQDPWQHGVRFDQGFAVPKDLLASQLKQQHYRCQALLTSSWLPAAEWRQGFHDIDEPVFAELTLDARTDRFANVYPQRTNLATLQHALQRAPALRSPFFLWIDLECSREHSEQSQTFAALDQLIQKLTAANRAKNTIIALLGLRGRLTSSDSDWHLQRSLSNNVLHVPAWLLFPGQDPQQDWQPCSLTSLGRQIRRGLQLPVPAHSSAIIFESLGQGAHETGPHTFGCLFNGQKWLYDGRWEVSDHALDFAAPPPPISPSTDALQEMWTQVFASLPQQVNPRHDRWTPKLDASFFVWPGSEPPSDRPGVDEFAMSNATREFLQRSFKGRPSADLNAMTFELWRQIKKLSLQHSDDRSLAVLRLLGSLEYETDPLARQSISQQLGFWADRSPNDVLISTIAATFEWNKSADDRDRLRWCQQARHQSPYFFPAVRAELTTLRMQGETETVLLLLRDYLERAPLSEAARQEYLQRMARTQQLLEGSP